MKSIGLCAIHIQEKGERRIENESLMGDSAPSRGGNIKFNFENFDLNYSSDSQ